MKIRRNQLVSIYLSSKNFECSLWRHLTVSIFYDSAFYSSLLCGSGDQIKVFSNGECVRRLVGHTGKVTSIVLNPVNSLQVT